MEVKQEVVEELCKIEIDDNELDNYFVDSFKSEIKAEPNSTDDTFDNLVLKELTVKSEIKYENKLESVEEYQKDGRGHIKPESIDPVFEKESPPPSPDSFYDSDNDCAYSPSIQSSDNSDGSCTKSRRITRKKSQGINKEKKKGKEQVDKRNKNCDQIVKIETSLSTSTSTKSKTKRLKNYCYFCKNLVLNFSRHLVNSHSSEVEVQKLLSKPINSRERKELIALIRKKGNYLNAKVHFKPMKKANRPCGENNYISCEFCLGLYVDRQFRRHKQLCQKRLNKTKQIKSKRIRKPGIDNDIQEKVIPTMRIDEVSMNSFYDSDKDCAYSPSIQGSDNSEGSCTKSRSRKSQGINKERKKEKEQVDKRNQNCDQIVKIEDSLGTSTSTKSKPNRLKNYCYFCENLVMNFSRHIVNVHSSEVEVQELLSKPINSRERKELIGLIRKKGNYLNAQVHFKPMKKTNIPCSEYNYVPCEFCLGLYVDRQFRRHRKLCQKRLNKNKQIKSKLIYKPGIDNDLQEKVFPTMRIDEVSMVAKTDSLICAFGARYFKSHREKHCINVTSRKMRELAKILIEVKKIEPTVQTLFNALNPRFYDCFVTATKIVAKYDTTKKRFESPTFAMTIGITLKQCCDIAITYALKKKDDNVDTVEADLKTMITLFESDWRSDILTDANKRN
ncbi:uncharacterized protein [Diabrotica undecimpunctata]|uniref:uncharacterized protein n=1 Tax=Diabrotica undecimpunctata TaxID=50387 RepID=UPI003B63E433